MWRRRPTTDDEFRDEVEAHVALEIDRLIEEGATPEAAAAAARRVFGNVTQVRERYYESRRPLWLDDLVHDVRFTLRSLRRSPGFTAVVLLTLAVGLGVNTSIFSVVNAVLLRPLPYRDPGTLVLIDPSPLSLAPAWLTTAWRHRAHTLSGTVGFTGPAPATLVHAGESQQIDTANVSGNFLSFLGVAPALGRDFVETDGDPGAPAVAILSHELWRRAFSNDPTIVGRTVTVTGNPFTVVGVTPAGFRFPTGGALPTWGIVSDTQPDVLRVANADARINVIGRLAPGHTPASATGELRAIFKQEMDTLYPGEIADPSKMYAALLQDALVGSVQLRLWLVMGAAGFVLLVACANVANLSLARASTRQRELALRVALGATRGRIARLVLTESILLALLGSAVAIAFAYTTSGVARALLAHRIPHVDDIPIDALVLAFNMAVSVATGVLCGLVSLPRVKRVNITVISAGDAHAVTGRSRTRRLLLSAETAITFVLFVGATLFAQTLWNLSAQDRGFDADRLLTVRVAPSPSDLGQNGPRTAREAGVSPTTLVFSAFFSDLRNRLERLPDVAAAAAVSLGPLEGTGVGLGNVAVNGRAASSEGAATPIAFVTPGYFRAMGIPIIAGRDFNEADRVNSDLVAVVNEAFQRRFVPNGDILGARVTSESGPEVFTVVGVTQDVPDRSLREGPQPTLIAPLEQMAAVHISWRSLTFVLRTADDDPLRLAPEVRRTIWAISPDIVIHEIAPMDARVALGMRAERDTAFLFGLFALAALVMAAIGVYGIAAYTLAQRTKEIGIRLALGAARHDIRCLLVSQTLWPTVIGVSVGVAAAALLTRLVASMVYGVTPSDPATFALGIIVLVSVALAATWMPVRRATQIDPATALRCE